MATLYDITNDYIDILNSCNSEEMPFDEIIDKLENIDETFNEKAENISLMIKELRADCTAISEEIGRLNKRLSTRYKSLKNLQNYLKERMITIGKSKIETPIQTISIRKSIKTEISEGFIDWALKNHKNNLIKSVITYKSDKKIIKEQLKNGMLDCPYAKLKENHTLCIR